MWLLGRAAPAEANVEAEELRRLRGEAEEAEELRLKLEALRMAEYRQAQRIACGLEAPNAPSDDDAGIESSVSPACSSRAPAAAPVASRTDHTQHYSLEEGSLAPGGQGPSAELESMYDFARFPAQRGQGNSPSEQCGNIDGLDSGDEAEEEMELERQRAAEAKLRTREQALVAEAAVQDKKLAAASRTLQRTKTQMRQLAEQISTKQESQDQCTSQADALQMLLAEKERRLMAALVEASSVLEEEERSLGSKPRRQEAIVTRREHEDQLMQLAALTEELTDALEKCQSGEEDARKQLFATAVLLQQERDQRLSCEQELATRMEDSEIASLQAHLKSHEQNIAWEHVRIEELKACSNPFGSDLIKKDKHSYAQMEV
jgi:hypothetical protein